jgi:transcriptional regulator with XRE-family HTH domain
VEKTVVSVVAKNIRKYREGLSLAKIAKRANLSMSTLETIYYRRRITDIKASTLLAIAKGLNISTDQLLGYKARSKSS